jgi:hypothetical protein
VRALDVRAVLTPEQFAHAGEVRNKLDALAKERRSSSATTSSSSRAEVEASYGPGTDRPSRRRR